MKKNKNMNRGAGILSIVFALLFFVVAARFLYIQITGSADGEALAVKAEEKYKHSRTLEAQRGSILDQRGEALAQDTSSFTVAAILDSSLTTDPKKPQHVVDKEMTAEKLAPVLNMSKEDLLRYLNKDAKQVEFGANGRSLNQAKELQIEKLNLPGIAFTREKKRFYPNGMFASDVIGYAAKKDVDGKQEITGVMGLEKSLDSLLKEKDGLIEYESDHYGWKLPNSKDKITPPQNGDNVYLTVDQKIQTFLEDAMSQAAQKYKPKKIIAIVADPKTGKILAMGQRPSFDPNKRNITNYYSDAVGYPFEPGSTMKIYTVASAMEEGVYNGKEKYKSGTYKVGSNTIHDHNDAGWGTITFDEGVQHSSNVAMAYLEDKKLGPDKFRSYLSKFGFDKKTGIDLPGEAGSKINFDSKLSQISAAFGQGSAFTAIQQIQAASAIANNGTMMKPYVIDKVTDPNSGKVLKENKPAPAGKPVSAETAQKMRELLYQVVNSKIGTGRPYQIPGYDIAGKTGTAQVAGPNGRYLSGRENFLFSFMGMAPAKNPQLLVYVGVQQPELKPTETGSMPVSDIFKTVMKNSLQYLQIRPENEPEEKRAVTKKDLGQPFSSYIGKDIGAAAKEVKSKSMNPIVLGSGKKVTAQYPSEGTNVTPNERVILQTEGQLKMPDMTGWTKRDVLRLADHLNLRLASSGSGFVVSQSIPKGSALKRDYLLNVNFMTQSQMAAKQKDDSAKKQSEDQ
ncbi:penicillin-binding protein [Metabacillus sp. GX 13764]|uniref:penicillin-binding protein n=1 Tax=Metabacillus kandeliae TaxID=2900151 RepID=UPI001E30E5A7|nr:penicillin-binding protein [Metabacillus kandeliae]MCD7033897.1 penicillin-binding protein [Metabacillus kandeliae]